MCHSCLVGSIVEVVGRYARRKCGNLYSGLRDISSYFFMQYGMLYVLYTFSSLILAKQPLWSSLS